MTLQQLWNLYCLKSEKSTTLKVGTLLYCEYIETTVQEQLETVDWCNVTVEWSCRLWGRNGKTGILNVQFSWKDEKNQIVKTEIEAEEFREIPKNVHT